MTLERLILYLLLIPAGTFAFRLGYYWVYTPLRWWFTYSLPAKREWLAGWPEDFAPAIRTSFEMHHAGLLELGFEKRCEFHCLPDAKKIAYAGSVFVHPDTREIAVVINTSVDAFHVPQVTFTSELPDGSSLETKLGPSGSFAPDDPLRRSINAVWIKDVSLLQRFHHARMQLHQIDAPTTKLLPFGAEVDFIQQEMSREMSRLEQLGYFKRVRRGERYRFSLYGAVRATRGSREPYRTSIARRRERLAREEWQKSGMADAAVAAAEPPLPKQNEADREVQYSATTEQGRFTIHRQPQRVTITMGGRTLRRHLLESSGVLLWPGLTLLILLPTILSDARNGLGPLLDSLRWEIRSSGYLFFFYGLGFAYFMFRIFQTWPQRKGPFEIVVTPDELEYRDAAANPSRGRAPASAIQGVRVLRYGRTLFRAEYVLCVHHHLGKPILLMRSTNREDLKKVENAVAVGLGLRTDQVAQPT